MKKYLLFCLSIAFPVFLTGQNTNPVGATAGVFDVSPSGAATYTIPIEIPPGINGIQPNLSLVYNSQSGNGIAGIGWNIGGLSMISRVNKNLYYDRAIAPFDWTKDSPFSLDGNRLIVFSTHSTDSIVYMLEVDDFSRVVGYNIGAYGPAYFKVYHKNGQLWQYGSSNANDRFSNYHLTTDGSRRLGWMLTSVVDTNGNEMQFHYTGELIQNIQVINHRISHITYARNRNVANMHSYQTVSFDYETRGDVIRTYVAGLLSIQEKRLKSIRIRGLALAPECSYRRYTLDYALSAATAGKSNLVKVTESSGCSASWANETVLNSTHINWTDYSAAIQTNTVNILGNESIKDVSRQTWTAVDVDGDGISEVVSIDTGGTYHPNNTLPIVFDIYKAQTQNGSTSFSKTATYKPAPVYNNQNQSVLGPPASCYFKTSDKPLVYVPVLTHWLIGAVHNLDYARLSFDVVDIMTGKTVLTIPLIIRNETPPRTRFLGQEGEPPIAYATGDINNDGFDDFIVIDKWPPKGIPNEPYSVHIRTGAPSQSSNSLSSNRDFSLVFNAMPQQILIADFNKDGLKDLCVLTDAGYEIWENDGFDFDSVSGTRMPSFSRKRTGTDFNGKLYVSILSRHNVQLGDVNGDGLPDFIYRKGDGRWYVAINDGNWGFSYEQTDIPVRFSESNRDHFMVLDFNDDGKSDILIVSGNTAHWYASNGTGFSLQHSQPLGISGRIVRNMLGDFTGDGKLDFIHYNSSSWNAAPIGHFLHTTTSPAAAGTVASITDGLNNRHSIDYKMLNDNSVYSYVIDYPALIETSPFASVCKLLKGTALNVVSRHRLSEASAEKRKVSFYNYANAVIHLHGKGFLGFRKTIETDSIAGIITETNKGLEDFLYVLYPESVTVKTTSNELIRSSKSTYYYLCHENDAGNISFSMPPATERHTDHLSGVSILKSYDMYDACGNVGLTTTTYDNGAKEQQYVRYTRRGTRCFSLPNSVQSLRTDGGETHRYPINVYSYDLRGNRTAEFTQDPSNGSVFLSKTYTYDALGRVLTARRNADGVSRQASYSYVPTASGYFPASHTDEAGNTETYQYNTGTGLLTSKTDLRGTTQYLYDAFGRTTKITEPDGVVTDISLSWDNSVNGSAYVQRTATAGQPTQWTYYNSLGEETASAAMTLNGNIYRSNINRDNQGRITSRSVPYLSTASPTHLKEERVYDRFGRISEHKNHYLENSAPAVTAYSYNGLSTTVTSPSDVISTKLNAAGQQEYVISNGMKVSYEYYPSGLVKKVSPQNAEPITLEYDMQGNRTKIVDPAAGRITSRYNPLGELQETKQAVHSAGQEITTSYIYNNKGLLTEKNLNGQRTYYAYDSQNRLTIEEIVGWHRMNYAYDLYSRPTTTTETITGRSYASTLEYDSFGRVSRKIYPSGYFITYHYDNNGILTSVKDPSDIILWQALTANAYGITSERVGTSWTRSTGYNTFGMLRGESCGTLFNLQYTFDNKLNMTRKDNILTNQSERYVFDEHNRLREWNIYYNSYNALLKSNAIAYDNANNITANTSTGYAISYGENGYPYSAPTSARSSVLPQAQIITYTDFKKISAITEGSDRAEIIYGTDEQRRIMRLFENNALKLTRYYLGDYEEEIDPVSGNIRKIHYISGGNGLFGIHIINSAQSDSLCFAFTDYQGNLIATAISNRLLRRYAYDPWGNRRNATNWTQADTAGNLIFTRGYTMHEHLDRFKLINMNGRVYDPVLASFLSPDPFVQMPEHWLNYNRYSYAWGNPLKYIDPTGEQNRRIITGSDGSLASSIEAANTGNWLNNPWFNDMSLRDWATHFFHNSDSGRYTPNENGGWNHSPHNSATFAEISFNTATLGVGIAQPTINGMQVGLDRTIANAWDGGTQQSQTSSSFWAGADYAAPVWGTAKMASDFLTQGDYGNALGFFLVANFEMLTLGFGSMLTQGAKMGALQSMRAAAGSTAKNATVQGGKGGLNLFKWGAEQTGKTTGWKAGDYMLHLPNRGTPQLNWKANYGALRSEMNLGRPIFDSYRLPNGNLIPTGGFLNAERFTLQTRGWIYSPNQGAWLPPIK